MTSLRERDPFDVRLARQAPAPLRAFNDAGVISAADVHVARRLAALGGVDDGAVLLALALAVRAPRIGHVLVDLATIRATVAVDTEEPVDLDALPWPDPGAWLERVAACGLVAAGEQEDPGDRPLRLVGTALYLDRYWREERQVAADLRAHGAHEPPTIDLDVLAAGLRRLFPDPGDVRGRMAAAGAVLRGLGVVAGGPGTGKTSAVGRIVALLAEQARAAGGPAPLIALAAPTGKAAARLGEAVHEAAAALDVDEDVRRQMLAATASTLHRLLGWRPDSRSRFRHDRGSRLPHDVVIVDETSMVSLTLMARLLEAVRPDARLVLVGDPDQLSSIEAGAVLGDVVGPATAQMAMRPASRARLAAVTGEPVPAGDAPAEAGALGDGIVVLDRRYRYGGAIAAVADAIRRGDGDAVIAALAAGAEEVAWIDADVAEGGAEAALAPVREAAVEAGRAVIAAAREGDAPAALGALGAFRLLCAHRRGPYGVSTWMPAVERWLAREIDAAGGGARDYPGRPLLITANDYDLNLFNGDTGVVVAEGDGRVMAAFERRGGVSTVRPNQLGAVETMYAMTVHKSQGSQFRTAAVIVPPASSRILTRELLYTAVTRARDRLLVVGTEPSIRAAVDRPATRASGLRRRLWGA
jgi:exodeoxyribonuclease V alpha subunit